MGSMEKNPKIYTRGGDSGECSILGGERRSKHDRRVEAYGTVDELSVSLGFIRHFLSRQTVQEKWTQRVADLQSELSLLCADLASPLPQEGPRIQAHHVEALEREIDEITVQLPPLDHFILPGGGELGCWCHQARAICRRAERRVTALAEVEAVNLEDLRYLNRLSDFLFTFARRVAEDVTSS